MIRQARRDDIPSITDIHNEAILNSTATFDLDAKSEAEQTDWFEEHGNRHPVLVVEQEGGVVGWASLSEYSGRCAYADTAEVSLYIRKDRRGEGLGKELTKAILQAGGNAGLHTVIARVAEGNGPSIHLLELNGFDLVGIMREVGMKFGRRLDVSLLQKIL